MYLYIFKHGILFNCVILWLILQVYVLFSGCLVESISINSYFNGFQKNHNGRLCILNDKCKIGENGNKNRYGVCRSYTFINPAGYSIGSTKNDTRCLATKFQFDEKAARKARHLQYVNEKNAKKKLARRTMKNMVQAVTKVTAEEHKQFQVQKFISDIQYSSNRKKLPTPPEIYSPSYDALLYLKGIPFKATENDIFQWLKDYDIINVVLIKNENGFFCGDAYVRCLNIPVRDKIAKEMANKTIGGRYIQVFRVNENAYLEYYHSGYRKEPKDRNYIDPSVLVTTNNQLKKLLNLEQKDQQQVDKDQKLVDKDQQPVDKDQGVIPQKSVINNLKEPIDVKDIKTGMRLVGTVTEVYKNGAIVECNIVEDRKGIREKVFCILKKNRIAKNIGLKGQQYEWLRMKQLVLYPGIKLNLYVEKVRETIARNTFDKDMWMEHLDESLLSTYFNTGEEIDKELNTEDENFKEIIIENKMEDNKETKEKEVNNKEKEEMKKEEEKDDNNKEKEKEKVLELEDKRKNKRALVYLTMDSSVSEDKVLWWEKKILKDVLSRRKSRDMENIMIKEDIKYLGNKEKMMNERVKVKEIYKGRQAVYGNMPNKVVFNISNRGEKNSSIGDKEHSIEDNKENNKNKNKENEKQEMNIENKMSMIGETKQNEENKEKEKVLEIENNNMEMSRDNEELPDDIPIGDLLSPNAFSISEKEDNRPNAFVLRRDVDSVQVPDKVEFVDADFQKLASKFFKNTTKYGKDIHFHDFEPQPELESESEGAEYDSDDVFDTSGSEDFRWMMQNDNRKGLETFPRLTLYDGAIKLPPDGLILRQSEVQKLSNEQIKDILELLEKESKDNYEENKQTLIEAIKNEGLPNDLLPQTLIQKGLYKVKQSKEYMRRIVRITKDLTGRKFSKQDLDAATSEELEMLVEEALYKFLDWNPPFELKKQFISNYHHLLEDSIPLPNISEVVPKPEFMKKIEGSEIIKGIAKESKNYTDDDEMEEEDDTLKYHDTGSLVDPNDENTKKIEKMWNDMKWLIVIFIYGEQSDLKEIVKQLEKDKIFEKDPTLTHTPMEIESLLIESKED